MPTREQLEKNAESVRTGGAGSVRRKRKAVHKAPVSQDDKKLGASLKKLGVSPIGDIEEVNLIMENGTVIHFSRPKVQASIPSNTYVVTGPNETKKLQSMLPQIINQLGSENVEQLKKIAEGLGEAVPAAAEKKEEEFPQTENFDA
eukprot:NODE_9724_length_568_cov_206.186517_g9087_i0.p1 GENE.NODE_9724_length_568_cov_206.186517_g9087_i0~~NODE_9724_length_568_cov_206.186517_g9087_i0.p1  ORF type:complete len:146 (+),score=41.38 NODE_9724_length_568_cov_206.186517_g9087_i0:54-491(+)